MRYLMDLEGFKVNKCPTCNKTVPRGHGHKIDKKYCNANCYHNRDLIDKNELLTLLNKIDNVNIVARLMGTYKQRIYNYIKREKLRRVVEGRGGNVGT